MYFKKILN